VEELAGVKEELAQAHLALSDKSEGQRIEVLEKSLTAAQEELKAKEAEVQKVRLCFFFALA
jgi:hypothetical protein